MATCDDTDLQRLQDRILELVKKLWSEVAFKMTCENVNGLLLEFFRAAVEKIMSP